MPETTEAPTVAVDRSYLVWRSFCEVDGCKWGIARCQTREHAISAGRRHVKREHRTADEWAFRVQGLRMKPIPRSLPFTRGAAGGRIVYDPHTWEPKAKSRDKNLPCGVCGAYRYIHDDIYGYVPATTGSEA